MSYSGPLIDAHHHFWSVAMVKHPWIIPQPGKEMVFGDPTPLYRDYLPEQIRADAKNWNLVGTVHIEAGWEADDPVGETSWLEELAAREGLPSALVVRAPLEDPRVEGVLEAQCKFPRVRGVRYILSWHQDPIKRFVDRPDWMQDRQWLEGFQLLEKFGLSFDLMIYPSQMADAAKLAADHPGTTILLNHVGSPADRDADSMARWRDGLKLLARQPNMRIKLSDLVAYDNDWTLESLREVTMACVDAFGPERCMVGSDFPVAGLHATWDEVFGSFDQILSGFGEDERRAMFFANAARDYRIAL
jgi:predicted TIM-barrel fold metal-dependent hydrolase